MSQQTDNYTNQLLTIFKGAKLKDSFENLKDLQISLEHVFEDKLKLDYEAIKNIILIPDISSISIFQQPETNAFIDNRTRNDIKNFEDEIDYLNTEIPFSITFNIKKDTESKTVRIYDKYLFDKWANSIDCLTLLKNIKKRIKAFEGLSINLNETETSLVEKPSNNDSINEFIIQNCRFMDFKDFPFNAFWFKKILNTEHDLAFCKKLKEVFLIFILAGIFDSTDFKEESAFYRLTGNKSFQAELRFDSINTSSIQTYLQIYEWIYTKEADKISDALSIARNILSIYLNNGSLDIDANVINSIKSNYKIYLQKNIDKYFELKLRLSEQLNKAVDSLSQLSDKYISTFKSNFFAGLSFYTSLFLMNFFRAGKGAFTREMTLFSLGFFIFSLLYLIISFCFLNKDYSYLNERYDLLKNRYKDLLVEEDIIKILSNDREYNKAKGYFEEKRLYYSLAWLTTVFILAILSYLASEYWNNCLEKSFLKYIIWLIFNIT